MKKKNNRELLYRLAKPILGPLFKLYYNTKTINKEYLNVDGPVVICCNHKHIMDQCCIIMNTKRVIHYMAKKEYFDSKFAWFFKSVGCIPVDRTIKDTEAKQAAIDTLLEDKCIGIFPEGTRNSLKDDVIKEIHANYFSDLKYKKFRKKIKKINPKYTQIMYLENMYKDKKISESVFKDNLYDIYNYLKKKLNKKEYTKTLLIPLKFGAVSMASKTDATIVPSAIIGDYKFRSKNLRVVFGKPFKVTEMDLESANKKLEDIIIELMNNN